MRDIYLHFAENSNKYVSLIALMITLLGFLYHFKKQNDSEKSIRKKLSKPGYFAVCLTVLSFTFSFWLAEKGNSILEFEKKQLQQELALKKHAIENDDIKIELVFHIKKESDFNEIHPELKKEIYISKARFGNRFNHRDIKIEFKLMADSEKHISRFGNVFRQSIVYHSTLIDIERLMKEDFYAFNLNNNKLVLTFDDEKLKEIEDNSEFLNGQYMIRIKNKEFYGVLNDYYQLEFTFNEGSFLSKEKIFGS